MSENNEIVNPQITDVITEENENTGHEIQGEVKPPSKWEQAARNDGWVPLEEWQLLKVQMPLLQFYNLLLQSKL